MSKIAQLTPERILKAVAQLSTSGSVTVPQLSEHLGVYKNNLYKALE